MAWEKWQQVYQDLKFANRMGGGAIRRMLNRKLSMAWEKWQYEAAEMKRQQMLIRRGLMRMMKAKMRGRSGELLLCPGAAGAAVAAAAAAGAAREGQRHL